jgi:hypothetical protein
MPSFEKTMTPLEISQYKQRWMMRGATYVCVNEDLDIKGKDWCRKNLERTQWSFSRYTNIYQHTFWFEDLESALEFNKAIGGKLNEQL